MRLTQEGEDETLSIVYICVYLPGDGIYKFKGVISIVVEFYGMHVFMRLIEKIEKR